MYERLLVPLDGSALSEAALPFARQIASRAGSEITLVYVSRYAGDPQGHMHELYLQRLSDITSSKIESHEGKPQQKAVTKTAVLSGNPAEQIVEYAEKTDVGLIIMTTHGYSGLRRWALGSVADKIVRATTRPVLLIRSRNASAGIRATGPMRRVVLPLDGSTVAEAVIPYIEEMASKLNLELVLLQVLPRGYVSATAYDYVLYTEQQMKADRAHAEGYLHKVENQFFKPKGILTRAEVRFGNAAEEIIKLAGEVSADLVAISTHGRSGVTRWVFGSVADRVLHEGDTPLLLVRSPGARVEQEGAYSPRK